MPFNQILRRTTLLLANILIPLACYVFATGFFPYKPLLPGLASFEEQDASEELGLLRERRGDTLVAERPSRLFDKVIFMVVDALRSDFVYGDDSGFHHVHSLIRDGGVLPFTAYAAAPTVTMPRIKALTTGSVPSFADLILNLDESDTSSSLAKQDTWLAQIRQNLHEVPDDEAGMGRLAFFGDDTWLKLFPGFFDQHDGTSSFFVSDFTEVDNNVTRHVPAALKSRDWDAMIMHYLGLDHIGHKTGPQGSNMIPKQREMDSIVKQVYDALETEHHLKDALLVLAGDHGMNSAGNHGGSAAGETSTAMLFASPKLKLSLQSGRRKAMSAPTSPRPGTDFEFYTKIQQSDFVPTLAALLDIPVPKNSLGMIVPEMLDLYKDQVLKGIKNPQIHLLYRNALQMLNIVTATYGHKNFEALAGQSMATDKCRFGWTGRLQLQCLWGRALRMLLAASVDGRFSTAQQIEALRDFLLYAQEDLSATASSYDLSRLAAGIAFATVSSLFAYLSIRTVSFDSSSIFFGTLTVLYAVMMFASSFVEEEQHIWYWGTTASLVVVSVGRLRKTSQAGLTLCVSCTMLILHRLANRWNQTGQKHAGEADIARNYFPEDPSTLWVMIVAVHIHFGQAMVEKSLKGIFGTIVSSISAGTTVVAALIFKYNFTVADAPELIPGGEGFLDRIKAVMSGPDLVFQARAVFLTLGFFSVVVVAGHSAQRSRQAGEQRLTLAERLLPLLGLLLLTQSRTVNDALFAVYALQVPCLEHLLIGKNLPWPRKIATSSEGRNDNAGQSTIVSTGAPAQISISILLLAYTSFFQLGNSNAISSIDLSQAYNGISSYNMSAVGILLFLSNWAGPVWWTTLGLTLLHQSQGTALPRPSTNFGPTASAVPGTASKSAVHQLDGLFDAARHLTANGRKVKSESHGECAPSTGQSAASSSSKSDPPPGSDSAYQQYLSWTTLFMATSLAATMTSCTILRMHLFIWTVFSPKYLYAVAWAIGWHFTVNVVWAGGLWLAS